MLSAARERKKEFTNQTQKANGGKESEQTIHMTQWSMFMTMILGQLVLY